MQYCPKRLSLPRGSETSVVELVEMYVKLELPDHQQPAVERLIMTNDEARSAYDAISALLESGSILDSSPIL